MNESIKCENIQHSFELYVEVEHKKRYTHYNFPEGNITYLLPKKNNEIVIYYVKLHPIYYSKGIWSNFIKFLMGNTKINSIVIIGISNYMIEYSTAKNYVGDNYWVNQSGDCIWEKNNKKKDIGIELTPKRLIKLKKKIKETYTERCGRCKEYFNKLLDSMCMGCICKKEKSHK